MTAKPDQGAPHHNPNTERAPHAKPNTERVFIFDTTLRDGEQCPGATMTFEEKLEVATYLDDMGVDIIEAGFPIASDGDFEAVAEIAKRTKTATIAGLARAIDKDIDRAGEAVRQRQARPHPHLRVDIADPSGASDEEDASGGAGHHRRNGDARAQPRRRRRVVRHGRHPHADRLSVPVRRRRHQGRRDDDQPARHGRLRHAGRVSRHVPPGARARGQLRQGDLLGALPQRLGAGRRQLAGRRRRRRAAGRMHDERHRRARRQCRAGRSRHGHQDARRCTAIPDRHREQRCSRARPSWSRP